MSALLLAWLAVAGVHASELTPHDAQERSPLAHARAVSLDLRGTILTPDEIDAVEAAPAPPPAVLSDPAPLLLGLARSAAL